MSVKKATKEQRRACLNDEAANLRESLPPSLQLAMDLAREKGASTWLTVLPIEEHGFILHKQAFRDAIALRYGWTPANFQLIALVASLFLSTMPCHAQREDTPLFDITKLET